MILESDEGREGGKEEGKEEQREGGRVYFVPKLQYIVHHDRKVMFQLGSRGR